MAVGRRISVENSVTTSLLIPNSLNFVDNFGEERKTEEKRSKNEFVVEDEAYFARITKFILFIVL